jgi:EAL domain-containing protein (putative c-di-GMP-specific phosphodiesterase class I)
MSTDVMNRGGVRSSVGAQWRKHQVLEALRLGHLEPSYQPVFDPTDRMVGGEALLRLSWRGAAVMPSAFVRAAERHGVVGRVTDAMVASAAALQGQLSLLGIDPATQPVSVNVSSREIDQPDVVRRILTTLDVWEADAGWVELEITETAAIDDLAAAAANVRRLRAAGCRVALDDFGTGSANLGTLAVLPVDRIKIDRSFVAAIGTDARAERITVLLTRVARELGIGCTAEGVETAAQLQWLTEAGCDRFQGYFLSPPVHAVTYLGSSLAARPLFDRAVR